MHRLRSSKEVHRLEAVNAAHSANGSQEHAPSVSSTIRSGAVQGRTIMDQNSNVDLQVVQGDFPIKYGPKTLKHPW